MSAPFRIRSTFRSTENRSDTGEKFSDYLDRLTKLVPSEIIGAYMIGSGVVPPNRTGPSVGWAVVCLLLVIAVRVWGTSDPKAHLPAQPVPVIISALAFVIWVYWQGGPFVMLGLHKPYIASLAVLTWSILGPLWANHATSA